MVGKQQLIVVVEGTAAISPFWHTIVSDYLKDIVRCFCENESMDQFTDCGFNDAAIADGLSEALMMFSTRNGNQYMNWQRHCILGAASNPNLLPHVHRPQTPSDYNLSAAERLAISFDQMFITGNENQNMNGQRHCILVAGSNPYQLPTPVYRPQTPSDYNLSDAEGLAKSFAQHAISLSVISPKKLPKLKAIYHAGKSDPQVADPPEDNNDKNPQFLVLISDNFMEARAALSKSGMLNLPSNQNPVETEVTPVGPAPISRPPLASVPPGMSQPMQPGMQEGNPNIVKFWEGKLSVHLLGQEPFSAIMEGYRDASEPDTTLSSNWNYRMEMFIMKPFGLVRKTLRLRKADIIVFVARSQHSVLYQHLKKENDWPANLRETPSTRTAAAADSLTDSAAKRSA